MVVLLAIVSSMASCGRANGTRTADGLPAVVIAGPDAGPWLQLIRAAGAAARIGGVPDLAGRRTAVVGQAAYLSDVATRAIVSWVVSGGRLINSNDALLTLLGIGRQDERSLFGAKTADLDPVAVWPGPVGVRPIFGPSLHRLATAAVTGVVDPAGPVLLGDEAVGRGHVVAWAVDPVAQGRDGHELIPTGASLSVTAARFPAGPRLQAAEVFIGPGNLPAALRQDPDRLAAALGDVRVALVAAWDDDFNNPADNYDYARLIDALHARGILAYAWFEPPFVSLRYWEDHPSCREKTESGGDAIGDWRRLIALEDPDCFVSAWQTWEKVLTHFPWDGVNVAELYFEPPGDPRVYTPFHPAALARFGHDPAADPVAFSRFRTGLVTELNRSLLRQLNGLPRASQLGFELTVVDDYTDPVIAASLGSDDAALAAVAAAAGSSVIVEDPFTRWERGPLRYRPLAAHVSSLLGPRQTGIDINIVNRQGAAPTAAMTGSELALAALAAAGPTGRLTVYSLGSIAPADIASLSRAMAGTAEVFDTGIRAPWPTTVFAPSPADTRLRVDGKAWPCSGGVALLPAGEHRLQWSTGRPAGPGIRRFTGTISTASTSPRSLRIGYDTQPDALLVLDERPTGIVLDGGPTGITATADPDGGWTIRLPRGTHQAVLRFA